MRFLNALCHRSKNTASADTDEDASCLQVLVIFKFLILIKVGLYQFHKHSKRSWNSINFMEFLNVIDTDTLNKFYIYNTKCCSNLFLFSQILDIFDTLLKCFLFCFRNVSIREITGGVSIIFLISFR